jgi:hypothetical protein
VPVVAIGASVAANVAFEYGYHRLQGRRASNKQLFIAGALGSIPLGRRLKKAGVGYRTQILGSLAKMGSKDEVALHMRNTVPGFMIRLGSYHAKSNLAHAALSRAYDSRFSRGGGMRTKRYTPRG